ncbi:transcription initiation factor IIB-like [Teleopsis dalmanni]|uniref:transcription initiation factor IIB-like n=1 Tax=Teleopsis dalmanni TaxID=139649 RepID=UPI0018CED371|nr:transcription initiation factor IIB-like [Teleopsis dalmanni]XP_037952733.1 transcription initiation factor IIB-like [Teleopsis dalmanni]
MSGASIEQDIETYGLSILTRCTDDPKDKVFGKPFSIVREFCSRAHMPDSIAHRAQEYFKKYAQYFNLRVETKCKCLAAIYMAARVESVPRSYRELAVIGGVSAYQIAATVKKFLRTLEVKQGNVNCTDFISRFGFQLELSSNVISAAHLIAENIKDFKNIYGRSPTSIAATALYLAAQNEGLSLTTKAVADIIGISSTTINLIVKAAREAVTKKASKVLGEVLENQLQNYNKNKTLSIFDESR